MNRRWVASVSILLASALLWGAENSAAPKLEPGQKWVFSFSNFAKDEAVQKLTDLMKRAKKAGYNGMLVSDVKFDKFQLMGPDVAERLKKFRADCTAEGMKFIVGVTPFGYADALLTHDPNLCEGMPVRKATFIVKAGKLLPFDDTTELKNGSFEEFKDNNPVGWVADDAGKVSFQDRDVKAAGNSSLRQEEPKTAGRPNARVSQRIKVKPWHYYILSVNVKTEGWTGKDMRLKAIGDGTKGPGILNWQPPPIKEKMDWTRIYASFCSFDNTEVTVYVGSWGAKTGKIWYDDFTIQPGGFINILRRDSLPLTISSLDGATTFQEGKDFSEVKDAKMLYDPNPGYYTIYHQAPEVSIPAGSRLKEGDKVLASYHFATPSGKTNNFNMCMAEPKVYEIVEKQIRWIKENAQPDMYKMSHDEIRIGGWDDSCVKTGKTLGQILADNIKKCTEIIKKVDPGKPILTWNDMFDPFHNADDKHEHYLAKGKGPWAGSWEGLTSDVGISTWCHKPESQKFFAERGHQQILAGYYDGDPKKIVEWLDQNKDVKNIVGVIYTTWVGNYKDIEAFIDHVKAWEATKK